MFDGFSIPLDRVLIALRHAATVSVTNAQIILRVRMPLLGDFTIPFDRRLVALRNALPVFIAGAEIVLRFGAAVLGKLAPSCDCLDVSTRIEIFARFVKTVGHPCFPP